MKRFILALLLIFGAAAAADNVSLGGAPGAEGKVVVDTPRETVVTFTVTGFIREREAAEGVSYDHIRLPGRAPTQEVGFPELPVIREFIMVPGTAKVRAEVVAWEEKTLKGYNVWPYQTPLKDSDRVAPPFVRDDGFYAGRASYPEKRVEVGVPGIFRDIRVVPLAVYPFRWNPATKELTVATKVTVRLEYFGEDTVNTLHDTGYRDPDFEALYRGTVLNYRPGPAPVNDAGGNLEHPEVLFICYPDYADEVAPLAEFYNKMGHYTKVVTTNETGTSNTSIKAYIQSVYDETTPAALKYVLLVGDIDYVAAGRWPGYGHVSDYWYSCLTGGEPDPYPDIGVGRFSTKDAAKVTYFVDKTIKYQKEPPTSDNWLDKATLVAHYEGAPGKYEGCCEETRQYNYALFNPIWTTVYGSQGKKNEDIDAAINAGNNIIAYRGHGNQTSWSGWSYYGSYTTANWYNLANGDKTPVVWNCCCQNGNLDYAGETQVEAELNSDDKAGLAGNGASIDSYTYPNHDYFKEWFKAIYDQGIYHAGLSSNYANTRVLQIWGTTGIGFENVKAYLWNGCPYTNIWLKRPTQTLTASHPTSGYTPGSNRPFTVTVTCGGSPVENALVGLYKKDDIYCAGLTDATGKVTLYPKPRIGTAGTMYVTATKTVGTAIYLGYWGQCTVNESTDVKVTSFTARRTEEGVRLNWAVTHGEEVLGFNIYRKEVTDDAREVVGPATPAAVDDGTWVKVNATLISGRPPYSFVDYVGEGNFFRYQLEAVTRGEPVYAGPVAVGGKVLPNAYALSQNYPNPARESTTIKFALPAPAATATVLIYDLSGRVVARFDLGRKEAGVHEFKWDLADEQGYRVPAGVYVYKLETPEFTEAKRLVVVR